MTVTTTTTTAPADQPASTTEQPAQPAAPAQLAATVADLHNEPYVVVTGGGREYRLRIDVARVFERTSRPIAQAVLIEAGRLLRRHAGYAPADVWRRDKRTGAWNAVLAEIPGRCETCLHGCDCRVTSDGCEHFGCLFVAHPAVRNSCPGVAVLTQPRRPRPPAPAGRR